jgi:L-fucose isomerase
MVCGDSRILRGGGYSSQYLTRGEMPVTMFRINMIKGMGPALQLAEGYAVNIPNEIHEVLVRRTNHTWPTTWFVPILTGSGPFRDVYTVMNNWGANHCTVSYGHIGSSLITLAAMLRIPVYMHNLSAERIFRPSAWSAFGANEPQGADFRACTNFGPLYGH